MVFLFQSTRPQQNFHPQIFLQRSVTKEKLPPMTKEKNPRNFDEVQVVASKRDVDGYLEAPTNFEQWKKHGPLVVVEGFFIGEVKLPMYVGIIVNHYKDPYSPTIIQWKVFEFFFSWLNRISHERDFPLLFHLLEAPKKGEVGTFWEDDCDMPLFWKFWKILTPLKTNIDTKNDGLQHVFPFNTWLCWVATFDSRGVKKSKAYFFFGGVSFWY